MRRSCLVYLVSTRFGAATMAPVIATMRKRAPHARHVTVSIRGATAPGDDLDQLGLAEPDYLLDSGSGSPVSATTTAMERIERVIAVEQPSLVVVSGDSTSALSAALTALKLGIRSAHIDAGLRSFDRKVPEEMNRVIIDSFADLLFVSSEHGMANLRAEGVEAARIHLVGSTMIDTLSSLEPRLGRSATASRLEMSRGDYLLVALREKTLAPSGRLPEILDRLIPLSSVMPVVLTVPREVRETVRRYVRGTRLRLTEPLGYLSFLSLEAGAAAVLTDRGGIQEETTHMGIPCFTLRRSTERTTTLQRGTNRLLGDDPARIAEIPAALHDWRERREPPPLWDGRAATRVADVLEQDVALQPQRELSVATGTEAR
jgi:UDP-N-acetylglucosamine 2-epimerase (non-hydrolysing)